MIQAILEPKNHFEENGTQNCLVLQPMYKYFKKIDNTELISTWKYQGLSDEIIKTPSTSNNSPAPTLKYTGKQMYVKCNEM